MASNRLPTATAAEAGTPKRRYKRKLKNYVLDKSLQLRYVTVVLVLSVTIAGVLGFLIWRQKDRASDAIREVVAQEYKDDAAMRALITETLTDSDTDPFEVMVVAGCGLMVVLFAFLVVMTHKLAGPLHKVGGYFDRMAQGRLGTVTPLRPLDMLKSFYATFSEAHDAVRQRLEADNAAAQRLLDACAQAGIDSAKDGELAAALEALGEHVTARAHSLS
ncbi:MAG TPA: hypothetical protein VFG83_10740 [Kofleriaceae bacterium]|nr:hypothetical protein [Kofleriaceae bacterium]